MLTDRVAAVVTEHEPGWRLPRRSDLARRYQATIAEIDAVIADLAGRGIVRVMADGQVYRASPAECLITLDQLPFLGTRIDPMGTRLTCASRNVLRRTVPEGITRALRLPPGTEACAVQTAWDMDGTPAAVSITYMPAHLADVLVPDRDNHAGPAVLVNSVPSPRTPGRLSAAPAALYLEIQPPPRWAARLLRLRQSEPAMSVTARLDDPAIGSPVALTVAILHAARFRISVETPPERIAIPVGRRQRIASIEPGATAGG